jgi:hypothetical protein
VRSLLPLFATVVAACGGPPPGPIVEARVLDTPGALRARISCRGGGQLAVEPGMSPYGTRPLEQTAVVALSRKDGTATCTSAAPPAPPVRAALRFRPMQIRAVAPTVVRDGKGARLVLSIDGQALGPRIAADDGVYLVSRGTLVPAEELCPEARFTDDRVVACVGVSAVAGRGPARVRVQSAGRLEEAAGAPIDLSALVAEKGGP